MINFPGFGGGSSSETLSLNLEKLQYHNGEKVKGNLTITSNKDTVSRTFRFIAEGKEETKITVSEPYYGSSSSSYSNEYRNVTYTSSNVFFSQDLLEFLKDNSLLNLENARNYKDVVIKKGRTEIPFEFTIPYNTLSSYHGKSAWITYSVKATLDKKMRMDVNSSINFDVISQSNNSNFNRPVSVSTYKVNGLELKLDLYKSLYNVGDTIRGTINISKSNPDIDIRAIEIILIATEKATASNRIIATTMYENKYKITDWKEKQDCPFEINIPENVVKSYRGKYSEIIWEVKAKIDLPLSQDLNAEVMIEVI
jgi:hypothetical protein